MNELQEKAWIDAARDGDPLAFEQLIHLYEKRVFALTRRMCKNPADAEEAAQETFLAAWQGLKFFRGESSFSTWLYRLTSNICIDFIRAQKKDFISGRTKCFGWITATRAPFESEKRVNWRKRSASLLTATHIL